VRSVPLRIRFNLIVAAVAAAVVGSTWWVTLRMGERHPGATFWLALGGILLITVLVDQVTRLLVHRRLAHLRDTMQRASAGHLDVRASVDRLDELGVVAQGLNEMLDGLAALNVAVDVRVEVATKLLRQKSVEIADSHREMAKLTDRLARAGRLAALGQAAANMAHQIGTPLNLISGYVQLLIQSSPPESATAVRLKAIQEQVAKVTAIVRAGLDSSRPPAVPHERIDLTTLVRQVCQMAVPMLDEAEVELTVVAPDPPAPILADPLQLELAVLNLLSNSVDAMSAGGHLTVRVSRVDHRFRLDVEDTGGGVAPELVAHIFDPWVTTKPAGKGSGLGLSIAKQVVHAHGGTITLDNRPSRGAIFTIDLPAAPEGTRTNIADGEHSGC
jgi:signal transduction histidine kinase